MPIHVGINQTENDRLISDQCLIVALGIRDRFLIPTTICYFPEHTGWFPIFVNFLLYRLNPIVWNVHGHTIIKAITAIFYLCSQSRHPGYLFRNGNCFGIHLMNQIVSQRQITNGIIILMTIEIVTVIHKSFTQPMAIIQHGSYAVETETVKLIFFQPILTVG